MWKHVVCYVVTSVFNEPIASYEWKHDLCTRDLGSKFFSIGTDLQNCIASFSRRLNINCYENLTSPIGLVGLLCWVVLMNIHFSLSHPTRVHSIKLKILGLPPTWLFWSLSLGDTFSSSSYTVCSMETYSVFWFITASSPTLEDVY
jgi:hypothetical protein